MMKRSWLALLLLFATTLLGAPAEVTAQKRPQLQLTLTCPALPLVADGFLRSHVSGTKEDGAFTKRVAEIHAERLDGTETLLTEPEYRKLEKRLVNIAKSVRKGECDDLAQLKKDQLAWHKEMESWVRKTAPNLKIDKNRELELDPKNRDRPKNAKEQAELRTALLEFQLANYLASGTDEAEARKKLVHRYELSTKRVEDQKKEDIYGTFLNAYASALDPHSTYFSPDDVEDFKIRMELSLTGIGAVLSSRDGFTIVEEIVPGGAADEHGRLKPKDQILAVAQGIKGEPVNVIDMDLRDVVKMIRGKKDTKVTLTVLRKGEKTDRMTFTITRDKIDLAEQAAKLRWHETERGKKKVKVAVIDLPSFYMGDGPDARDSAKDVADLITQAKKGKADGIVLDLSRNGGGALESAVAISGLFLESGSIVGVGGKGPKTEPDVLNDKDSRLHWDGPLVVLTSKISASASEILAGALQDYRRAIVVGDEHTFGKGSVQQLRQLPPGLGLVKVTTALYYLPGGKSTQSTGVVADIKVPSAFSTLDIGEKHQPYALAPATTKGFTSGAANRSKKWTPVDKATISKIRKKSEKRVAANPEFKELRKELSERDPNNTKIKISEILENGSNGEEEEEEEKEDELSIQAKEAAEILADYTAVQ